MSISFLVETADGTLIRKVAEELLPDDKLVFDGPDAFASAQAAQDELNAEIKAAGGLEAWRARS
jgi:hypothetical protein